MKRFCTALAASFVLLLPIIQGAAQEQKAAEASIPFEFWIGGSRLPAGVYRIEHLESTSYFFLRSADRKTAQAVYTLPVDDSPATDGDSKLVFRIANGRHYLYGGWGPFGRRVVTAESTRPVPSGYNRADVLVTYR